MDRNETYLTEKALAETPDDAIQATDALLKSFGRSASRRTMLKGALATAAGATLAASPIIANTVFAQSNKSSSTASGSTAAEIFTIAATAETLAVTFYNNALAHCGQLGMNSYFRESFESIVYEEDIHRSFFIANGGKVLTETFSFPKGMATFTNKWDFILTQQQLEAVFDSAFFLAVRLFAEMGASAVSEIAAQIAAVEQGHLVTGRVFGWLRAEPYVFAPALFSSLSQIVPTVKAAGYLSPTKGNEFTYQHAKPEYVVDAGPGGKTVLNAL